MQTAKIERGNAVASPLSIAFWFVVALLLFGGFLDCLLRCLLGCFLSCHGNYSPFDAKSNPAARTAVTRRYRFLENQSQEKNEFSHVFFPLSRGMVARGIEKIDRGTRFFREIKFETRLSSHMRSEKFSRFAQSRCRMLMRLQRAPVHVATRGCAGPGCQMRRMGRILFSSLPTLIASLEAVAWKRS